MSAEQASEPSLTPHPGITYAIPPEAIEKYWEVVASMLQPIEAWTQCVSAQDLRQSMVDGLIRCWAALDHAGTMLMGISAIQDSVRGKICSLWIIAPPFCDDASISSLVDECEAAARVNGCFVLAINAYPALAERIKGNLKSVTLERDLRALHKDLN